MKYLLIILVSVLIVSAAACGGSTGGGIEIEDAWVRAATAQAMMEGQESNQAEMSGSGQMESMSGSNTAAYMVIKNTGSQPDRLLSAYSDAARSTEIHISEMNEGVMSMRPVDGVDVPARGQAELKPGSYHIMLVGINRDLTPGETLNLKLEFQNAGEVEVQAEVRAP